MRLIKFLLLLSLLIFQAVFIPTAVRADLTFTSPTTSIDADQELELNVTLSLQGQDNKTYYLEGAFKKDGGSTYFGLTYNDSSWVEYSSSDFSNLKSITTDSSGSWTGTLKVKLDQNSSQFIGSGNYPLKLKRFTTGGSVSWSETEIILAVTSSSPTPTIVPTSPPTPSKTPTPTKTPTPQPGNTSQSSQPTNKPGPTLTSPSQTPKSSSKTTNPSPTEVISQQILGLLNVSPTLTPTPSPIPTQVASFTFNNVLMGASGIILLLISALAGTFLIKSKR